MTSRKTWVWAVVVLLAIVVVTMIVVAGAGVYFVTSHIKTERVATADALQSFEAVKASLPTPQPLFELDEDQRPRALRPLTDLPTSATRPDNLLLLAWDPDGERLIRASLPLWMVRFGKGRMHIGKDGHGFELDRLELDGEQLARIGPALVVDVRSHDGTRLLLWTQ